MNSAENPDAMVMPLIGELLEHLVGAVLRIQEEGYGDREGIFNRPPNGF